MSTKLEICTEAAGIIGGRLDLLPTISRYFDRAYTEAQVSNDARVLRASTAFGTSDGVANYPLPVDFWAVRRVKNNTSPAILKSVSPERYDTLTTQRQSPRAYSIFEGYVWLWPTPDAAYDITLRYRRKLPVLLDEETHLLGPEWDDVLLYSTAARAADSLNEHDRATNLRRIARFYAKQLEDDEAFDLLDRNEGIELVLGDVTYGGTPA